MLNLVYQLVAPRRFEISVKDVSITESDLVVRPTHLSICNADQRYYQGTRGAKVMAEKLPMALIHEAIGEVVFDPSGRLECGTKVALIPNMPCEEDPIIAENYLRSSKFRASSADGFMQELVVTTHDRVVELPSDIDPDVASFTELVSVLVHIIGRFDSIAHSKRTNIGFWGDGNVGFIGSLLFKKMHPESNVFVFGLNAEKLADFTFADKVFLTSNIPSDLTIDHAFECVGGMGAASAIEQIIECVEPEASIALCGVSENPVPINTRMVLEKGLRLFGSSRSGRADFVHALRLLESNPSIVSYLKRIVGQTIDARTVDDIAIAFEMDIQKRLGKTVIHWDV